jgi:hypothetical protein
MMLPNGMRRFVACHGQSRPGTILPDPGHPQVKPTLGRLTLAATADDNEDKKIRTEFYSVGSQYMFNRSWGIRATVPYTHRYFRTTDEDSGEIVSYTHSALGDMHVSAVYTGFSPDMSSGANFGLKLPTGDYKQNGFDRDTAIGSGSTDLLLGGWHMGRLTPDNKWSWYMQGEWDQPVLIQDHYPASPQGLVASRRVFLSARSLSDAGMQCFSVLAG